MTYTVEITQHTLSQRLPAESIAKGQKLLAQGNALGNYGHKTCRPVRAKASKNRAICKAVALTGRLADCYYTQGVALG